MKLTLQYATIKANKNKKYFKLFSFILCLLLILVFVAFYFVYIFVFFFPPLLANDEQIVPEATALH